MAKITPPIPQDKIGESFVWRDWFQRLSDKVFGTMGTQDSTNVSITGGTIDGTSIGATTPSTGKFTSVNTSLLYVPTGTDGQLLIGKTSDHSFTPATLTAGSNITITNGAGSITIASTGGSGTGDVVGPASATDNAVVRFDTTTGKLIQNSVTTIDDTGNASGILSQQFSNGSAVTFAAGKVWYDGSTGAWNMGMGNGNITQQVGEEIFIYGKASAAITDSPLQIVYHTGTVGASGVIKFAPTVASITDVNAILGVATESLALNAFGRITAFGVVHGITTNGTAFGETWADDDVIWYNPVTGNPTNIQPVAPNIKVQVGLVINAGSSGSGSFQVLIGRGSTLGGTDSNVQITSPANKDLLAYSTSSGYWKNSTFSSLGIGSVTSVALALPSIMSVSGSPVTSSGTLTGTLTTQSVNTLFAGPSSGAAATPTFRALVTADIPSLSYVSSVGATAPITSSGGLTPTIGVTAAALNKVDDTNVTITLSGSPSTALIAATTMGLGWTGQLAISRGGTGAATTTSNFVFIGPTSGSPAAPSFRALTTTDIPSLAYVTSVGLGMPAQFAVTNSPVTSSGTLTAAWTTQAANVLLAGPSSGVGAVPTFRALTTADIPSLSYVTSVALSLPSILTVSGSPVTSSGTLTGTLTTQAVNTIFAGPSSGAGVAPTFRSLTTADIPTLNQNTTGTAANITATSNSTLTTLSALSLPGSQVSGNISGNAANVTGTVAIGNGGTGQSTAAAAFNALAPVTTTGDLIVGNGTNSSTRLAIGANNYVLTSNGTTASWAASSGSGATISNDTSTSTNLYPLFANATSGAVATVYTGNANYLYKPSTGELTSTAMISSNGIQINSKTVAASYTIATGNNGLSAGPVSVSTGITVTISTGSVWTVV